MGKFPSRHEGFTEKMRRSLCTWIHFQGFREAIAIAHRKFPSQKEWLTPKRASNIWQQSKFGKKFYESQVQDKPKNWVPDDSQRSKMIEAARALRKDGLRWSAVRERVAEKFPNVYVPSTSRLNRLVGGKPDEPKKKSKAEVQLTLTGPNLRLEYTIDPAKAQKLLFNLLEW